MSKESKSTGKSLFSLTPLITVVAVALLSLRISTTETIRWATLGLLTVFGILSYYDPGTHRPAPVKHLYLTTQTLLVIAILAINPITSLYSILFFVLSAITMLILPRRQGLTWIGIYSFISLAFFIQGNGLGDGILLSLPYIAGYTFFAAFAYLLKQSEEERARSMALYTELQEAHQQLRQYAERVEELAIAEERNRLAREMHDTIGHRLTVVSVQLQAAGKLLERDTEKAKQAIDTAYKQVGIALDELRSAVAALRQPLNTDQPVDTIIKDMSASFQNATGITVHTNINANVQSLPPAYRMAVTRVMQEALTNIQKHAQAQHAWITLTANQDRLHLTIEDDGNGFPDPIPRSGFGLIGIRERASHAGGECTFSKSEHGGAKIDWNIPIAN